VRGSGEGGAAGARGPHGPAQCRVRVTGRSPWSAVRARIGDQRGRHPPGITGRGQRAQSLRRGRGTCLLSENLGLGSFFVCSAAPRLLPRRRFGTAPAVACAALHHRMTALLSGPPPGAGRLNSEESST
jgi:hypothetical protein